MLNLGTTKSKIGHKFGLNNYMSMDLEQYKAYLAQKYMDSGKAKKSNLVKLMKCESIKQLLLLRKKLKLNN